MMMQVRFRLVGDKETEFFVGLERRGGYVVIIFLSREKYSTTTIIVWCLKG